MPAVRTKPTTNTSDDANKRRRNESSRQKEGRENEALLANERAKKRQTANDRRRQRAEDEEESMLVEQDHESLREARLREAATAMQAQNEVMRTQNEALQAEIAQMRRIHQQQGPATGPHLVYPALPACTALASAATSVAAPAAAAAAAAVAAPVAASAAAASFVPVPAGPTTVPESEPEPGSVPVPESKASVNIKMLRSHMGLASKAKDSRWRAIRASLRDFTGMASLDFTCSWKRQDKAKLSILYNMAKEEIPELRRFANNWGAEYLLQEAFNHRRGHILHKEKQEREEAVPAAATSALQSDTPPSAPPSDSAASPPLSFNGSPAPSLSPSPTPPAARPSDSGPSASAVAVASANTVHSSGNNMPTGGNSRGGRGRGGRGRGGRGCGGRGRGRGGRGRGGAATAKGKGKVIAQGDLDIESDSSGSPLSSTMGSDGDNE